MEITIESTCTTDFFEGRCHVQKELVVAGAKSDLKNVNPEQKDTYSDLRGAILNIPREPGTPVLIYRGFPSGPLNLFLEPA